MPLKIYRVMHGDAALSSDDRRKLAAWFTAAAASVAGGPGSRPADDHDEREKRGR